MTRPTTLAILVTLSLSLSACGGWWNDDEALAESSAETAASGTISTGSPASGASSTGAGTSTGASTSASTGASTGAAPAAASGGKLTLTASSPSLHDGELNTATATSSSNTPSAADGAIATPYCAVRFEGVGHSANTNRYEVSVYFRQSDGKVLNASTFTPTVPWAAGEFDPVAGVNGVVVNVAQRTVSFTNKTLTDVSSPGSKTTVNGSFSFPASTVAACGV